MRHESSYDGLRAFSVGGVLLAHVTTRLHNAALGVEVFFALSGYLITRILLDEERRTGAIDLKRFYYRRALRLTPALVLVVVLVSAWAAARNDLNHQIHASLTSLTYTMNFSRAFLWGDAYREQRLGHTWSLSTEEQFYLLWPALMILLPANHRVKALAGLIAGVCVWRGLLLVQGATVSRVYNGFDTHAETC